MKKLTKAWGFALALAMMAGLPALAFADDAASADAETDDDQIVLADETDGTSANVEDQATQDQDVNQNVDQEADDLVADQPTQTQDPSQEAEEAPVAESTPQEGENANEVIAEDASIAPAESNEVIQPKKEASTPQKNEVAATAPASAATSPAKSTTVETKAAAPQYTQVKSLLLDEKHLYTNSTGALMTKTSSGKYVKVKNVTWNNKSRTLTMNGAHLGSLDALHAILNIILAAGTENSFSGSVCTDPSKVAKATLAGEVLNISGKGTLNVIHKDFADTITCGDLIIKGGANVFLDLANDKNRPIMEANSVTINNGTLKSTRGLSIYEELTVNKNGTLIVDAVKTQTCLTGENPQGLGCDITVNGGTVKLYNRTDYSIDLDCRGITLAKSITVNAGTLLIDTLGLCIDYFHETPILIAGGVVDLTSHCMQAISTSAYNTGSLAITGGDVTLTSYGTTTFDATYLDILGGKFHSIVRNPKNNSCAGIVFNAITIAEGMGISLPENGYVMKTKDSFYTTIFNEDGSEATEVTIEKLTSQPDPGPVNDSESDSVSTPQLQMHQASANAADESALPATGDATTTLPFVMLLACMAGLAAAESKRKMEN